jgi:hypothetical protein
MKEEQSSKNIFSDTNEGSTQEMESNNSSELLTKSSDIQGKVEKIGLHCWWYNKFL